MLSQNAQRQLTSVASHSPSSGPTAALPPIVVGLTPASSTTSHRHQDAVGRDKSLITRCAPR